MTPICADITIERIRLEIEHPYYEYNKTMPFIIAPIYFTDHAIWRILQFEKYDSFSVINTFWPVTPPHYKKYYNPDSTNLAALYKSRFNLEDITIDLIDVNGYIIKRIKERSTGYPEGYTSEEYKGTHIHDIIIPPCGDTFINKLQTLIKKQNYDIRTVSIHRSYFRKSNEIAWIMTIMRLYDPTTIVCFSMLVNPPHNL